MKKLVAALIASMFLLSACGGSSVKINQLDAAGFATKIQEEGVTILDVRRPDEFAAGHIPGAVNMNVEDSAFKDEIKKLAKSGTYAIYCHSGRRSMIAANDMAGSGFLNIYNLTNGINEWNAVGGPLIK